MFRFFPAATILFFIAVISSVSAQTELRYEGGQVSIPYSGESNPIRVELIGRVFEVYRVWEQSVISWKELDCRAVRNPNELKKNWSGFYTTWNRPEKIAALERTIRGISSTEAAGIVDARYFDIAPPSTWAEFKSIIARIESDLKFYGIYKAVVEESGPQNSKQLGYAPQNSGVDAKSSSTSKASPQQNDDPWLGFWSAPKEKKAQVLQNVLGVDNITLKDAKMILFSDYGNAKPDIMRGKYFIRKPQTWDDFKEELKKIDRELSMTTFRKVVELDGSQVKQRLYAENTTPSNPPPSSDPDACVLATKSGPRWILSEERKREVRRESRPLTIVISDAKLLSWEKESINIKYDVKDDRISIDAETGTLNTYRVKFDGRDFVSLQASARKALVPPASDFTATLLRSGPAFVLRVTDQHAGELQRLAPEMRWQVSYTLRGVKGKCSKDEVKESKVVQFEKNAEEITVGAGLTLDSGKDYYLQDLKVERLNQPYFQGFSGSLPNTSPMKY